MNIAITHLDLTTESGDPKHLLSIAQGLKKLGHSVVIYCAEFKPESCFPRLNKGLDVRVVAPRTPLSSLRGAKGVMGKILERMRRFGFSGNFARRMSAAMEQDFDVVIFENDPTYKVGRLYKKVNSRAKMIWIMHNPPFFHSPKKNPIVDTLSKIAAWFEKKSAQRNGRVMDSISVFDEKAKRLADEVGSPVKLVHLPADVDYFYAPVKVRVADNKSVKLISLGALSPTRRFEDTIAAAAILREKGYDARVTLICKDYWADEGYRKEFESFISSSGIAQYVDARFAGSTEEELLAAVRVSDIFVLPNNVQVWAIGACEAMAAGLPLIISRATATAEVLHDAVDALFVDALHPEEIAEKIEMLMRDPKMYAHIAAAGQKLVKETLSVEGYVREMLASVGG
jgi:glycosyltransferase involved in cell wall biosynthesis